MPSRRDVATEITEEIARQLDEGRGRVRAEVSKQDASPPQSAAA
jgi:hypothetical protein